MVFPIFAQLARRHHVSLPSRLALPFRLILVVILCNTFPKRARTMGDKCLQKPQMKSVRYLPMRITMCKMHITMRLVRLSTWSIGLEAHPFCHSAIQTFIVQSAEFPIKV